MLLTLMITELTKKKPNSLDYAYVFYLLSLFEEEELKTRKKVKKIIRDSQRENFNLSVNDAIENLDHLKLEYNSFSLNSSKYITPNLDKLVDKQFDLLSKVVKNQILNMLNTSDSKGLLEALERQLKIEKKNQSTLSRLMRIARTENTRVRSQAKLDIQRELAKQGIIVKRRWLHTLYNPKIQVADGYEPRLDHLALNGIVEDNAGYFHTPLASGKAPGMFGLPEEDINCRCDVEFIIDNI